MVSIVQVAALVAVVCISALLMADSVRWFKNLCEKSEIASDLSLYYLGEYDLEGGAISSAPEFVMNGVLEVTK